MSRRPARRSVADMMEKTQTVLGGGGLRLHVEQRGEPLGPPIVFVHGWSQSQLCWERQLAGPLAREFRLVTFDLRGHGMSARPAGGDGYGDARLWADDLHAVLEGLALARPVLVAWSYGAFVATDFLRIYGEDRVAGLNLVGGAVHLTAGFDDIGPGLLENAGAACGDDLGANVAATCRFLRACTARPLDEDDLLRALGWTMAVPADVRRALFARRLDADDVLRRLSIPVLVTHGRADAIVLPSMAKHVLATCPTARPSWYDGVGHAPFMEDAARFDRELAELVRDCVGAAV